MTTCTRGALMAAAGLAIAGLLSLASAAPQPSAAKTPRWAAADVLPLTCAQAWVKSRKTYSGMRSIVVTLARVSLANRALTFPDTRDAGLAAGRGIAEDCKADPNGLLFAFVDKQVRQVAAARPADGQ